MIEFLKGAVTPKDLAISGAIAAIAAGLCVAFVFVVVMPKKAALEDLKANTLQARKDLELAEKTSANMEELERKHGEMQSLVSEFEQRLPTIQEIPTLLRTFEGYAEEIGLRLDLQSSTPKEDARKETRPYKVKAQGDFHQIATFINLLERSQRYFKITDLELDEQVSGVSEAKFTLSTYRFKESLEGAGTAEESK
ncbi:MAG TPA: hypothetical protein ENN80_10260 [Candidatus Hydrogenedentes bacterium]|nr:hypothetical protein [Candidatus Hydrogenedentota bacterium]